jgi:hydroxymethylbilane synthase
VIAERSLLAALGAGCAAPLGALAEVEADTGSRARLRLRAMVSAVDGSRQVRCEGSAPLDGDPQELGRRLAGQLLAAGAAGLVAEASTAAARAAPPADRPTAQRSSAAPDRQTISQAGEGDL